MTNGSAMLQFSRGFTKLAPPGTPVVPVALRAALPAGVRAHTLTSSFLANLAALSACPRVALDAVVLAPMVQGPGEARGAFVKRVQLVRGAAPGRFWPWLPGQPACCMYVHKGISLSQAPPLPQPIAAPFSRAGHRGAAGLPNLRHHHPAEAADDAAPHGQEAPVSPGWPVRRVRLCARVPGAQFWSWSHRDAASVPHSFHKTALAE